MERSLVLVGVNTRALAQSAVWAGYDVLAIDAIGHLDHPELGRCLSLAYDLGGLFPVNPQDWMRRIARAAGEQSGRSLAYSGGFENMPDLVEDLSRRFELLGNSPNTLLAARDPLQLRDAAASVGLATPELLPPGALPDPAQRWLRKPRKSGNGFSIEPWTQVVPDDSDFIVQRQVEGVPHSVVFLANGSEARVFAVTRQLSGDPAFGAQGYAYAGNLLIPRPDPVLLDSLTRLAEALTRAFGLVGVNGIDFILEGETPVVLELNPRYSGSMELYEEAVALPLFGLHAAACRRQPLPDFTERPPRAVFGKAVIYAREDGVLPDTTRWLVKGWRDVPHAGTAYRAGMPLATVTAVAMDPQRCYERLVRQARAVMKTLRQPA